jgi:hypothetical protein
MHRKELRENMQTYLTMTWTAPGTSRVKGLFFLLSLSFEVRLQTLTEAKVPKGLLSGLFDYFPTGHSSVSCPLLPPTASGSDKPE